jgi:predicted PurR-regulated permease PerM
MVILTAVLYSGGESWAAWARGFGRRLADEHGERMVLLAGGAIRGVAMGVVVTAVMFALCIAQLGPLLVLLGAAARVYYSAGAGWGTFMLVWALAVGLMDNFVRPILIRREADLPLLLIFAGVIGGLVAFGIVGIFVGPVILAVSYTLLDSWVASGAAAHEAAPRTTGTP